MSWDVSPLRPSAPSLLPIALGVRPSLLRIRLGMRILPRLGSGELGRTGERGLWITSSFRPWFYCTNIQTRLELSSAFLVFSLTALYTVNTVPKPKNEFLSDTVQSASKTVYCCLRTKVTDGYNRHTSLLRLSERLA